MAFDVSGDGAQLQARPAPQDVPYRPARSLTRRQRGDSESSPRDSMLQSGNRDSKEVAEDVPMLDPRRFTPTLHANLVSEILALRRDLEAKHQMIDGLEATLNTTKQELEQTTETLNSTSKETRSLRRQMQLLEGGTSSALGELARERDEATEASTDLKKRLETSQKKLRIKEEDNDRMQMLWEKDRDNWDAERRKLEHKVHVVEGRLKAVLDEVAHHQAEQEIRDDGHVSDNASVQSSPRRARLNRMSVISNDDLSSMRYSMLNGPNGYGGTKLGGLTLAEELEAEDELSEEESEHDEGAITDTGADSTSSGHKHSQSLDSTDLNRPSSVTDLEDADVKPELPEIIEERAEIETPKAFQYAEIGIQYSPPPSPETKPVDAEIDALPPIEMLDAAVQVTPPAIPSVIITPVEMISSSCQTLDYPLSPPWTPTAHAIHPLPTPKPSLEMISIATQTSEEKKTPPPISVTQIPLIQIHPPTSAPTTPKSAVLPPLNKNVATQANIKSPVQLRSISMQTEEIKIDQRSIKLPPHLLPSAISSKPPTPEPEIKKGRSANELRAKKRRPTRGVDPSTLSAKLKSVGAQDAYPGNNDNGPLDEKNVNIKRPFRSSSLFAGFDVPSSDDAEDFNETEMSDNDFKTQLSARPRGKHRLSRVVSKPPRTVPEESGGDSATSVGEKNLTNKDANAETAADANTEANALVTRDSLEQSKELEAERPMKNPERAMMSASKPPSIRKSALISSGTAAHIQRARSPSLGTATVSTTTSSRRVYLDPPFPVPKRASSRNVPGALSDGTRSPTRSSFYSTHSRRSDYGKGMMRRDSLRKSRSAFALTRNYPERQRSRSPPPLSTSSIAPDSPHPPLPRDDITNPYAGREHAPESVVNSQAGAASISSSMQQTNVVDSIAQTMIGEWMWKYVRRRKSFGVPESPPTSAWGAQAAEENASSNGQRHKRWVWLAPYDRSIMWASRQPTTGTALMGKSGKKLVIQSVLDVKDETPLKQGSQAVFNRSILILTPARALKFTAVSKERHYVWLTALSFLSHAAGGPGDILLPPLPFETSVLPGAPAPQNTRSHRPIRDSIRIAKGKRKGFFAEESIREVDSGDGAASDAREAAAAPTVPRFLSHTRKRSNTGPRAPPALHPALMQNRSVSHNPVPIPSSSGGNTHASHNYQPSMYSTHTTTSSDLYYNITAPNANNFYPESYQQTRGSTSFSLRPSTDAQSTGSYALSSPNFFDAVGTMRMEAFVERSVRTQPQYAELEDPFSSSGPPSATTWGTRPGNRNSGASSATGRWSRILSASRSTNYNAPRGKTAPGGSGDPEFWGLSDDFFGVGERGMGSGRIVGVEDPFREF